MSRRLGSVPQSMLPVQPGEDDVGEGVGQLPGSPQRSRYHQLRSTERLSDEPTCTTYEISINIHLFCIIGDSGNDNKSVDYGGRPHHEDLKIHESLHAA